METESAISKEPANAGSLARLVRGISCDADAIVRGTMHLAKSIRAGHPKIKLAKKARDLAMRAAMHHRWSMELSDASRESCLIARDELIAECRKVRAAAGLRIPANKQICNREQMPANSK